MQKIVISVYLTLFSFLSIYSQTKDTVPDRSLQLEEIVVTGSRPAVNVNNLPMSVSVVEGRQIESRFEQSLLPVIMEEVPGLFITSRSIMGYGVAAGSAGGMSIRGIGGSPTTQVLMLIDGHPQYMGLMGHPLADSYQSLMAERVEVVRGPASVLYGSNAMGGVINIITKKQPQNGSKTTAKTGYGSYNTLTAEANNAFRSGKFHSYLSLGYNRSDGQRKNMEFEQYSSYAKIGYDFSNRWKSFVDMDLTRFNASNPGPVRAPIIDNDADVTRGVTSFSLENSYDRTSGALKFFYNFGLHEVNDGYKPGGIPGDSLFRSNDDLFGVTLYQTYRFFRGNQTTAGFDFQRFGGHAWYIYSTDKANRDIVEKNLNEVAGYLNFQQRLLKKFMLNAGVRVDNHEITGTEWIPQIGLSFFAAGNTVFKGIVSKGFRNPTIREMYMFPPQNPNLKAESLMNYELSASQKLLNQKISLDLSLYYIEGENSIQTILVDGKPLNVNTGEINNYGLEFAGQYRINPRWYFSTNYSWLYMKHKVLAAPEHKLYSGINYAHNKWMFSTGIQFIHNLYTSIKTTVAPEKKETFTLWNVRAGYKPVNFMELFIKGENLLSQKYEINNGYPMPGATVFGGLVMRF
jgi:iron complex outermembrane receptor protein